MGIEIHWSVLTESWLCAMVREGALIKPGWLTNSGGSWTWMLTLRCLFPVHLSFALSNALDKHFLAFGHVHLWLLEVLSCANVLPHAHSCQSFAPSLSKLCILKGVPTETILITKMWHGELSLATRARCGQCDRVNDNVLLKTWVANVPGRCTTSTTFPLNYSDTIIATLHKMSQCTIVLIWYRFFASHNKFNGA